MSEILPPLIFNEEWAEFTWNPIVITCFAWYSHASIKVIGQANLKPGFHHDNEPTQVARWRWAKVSHWVGVCDFVRRANVVNVTNYIWLHFYILNEFSPLPFWVFETWHGKLSLMHHPLSHQFTLSKASKPEAFVVFHGGQILFASTSYCLVVTFVWI